ncbi:ABC transporter permease [Clostridiales bacterium]|nr:ABC transporter permease [Clostridiales bacterium]
MSGLFLLGIEWSKLRRSKIVWILVAAAIILWVPSVLNAHLNFQMQAEGISPENNFFIQGFMGLAWFLFPASIVVSTVLLTQIERGNGGILKMLTLPVDPRKLCLGKFTVLLSLSAFQMIISTGVYFISGAIASQTQNYDLLLGPAPVLRMAGVIWLTAIPMAAFFWMLSVCVKAPVFSMGIGLASIVPSVLMINTKAWFLYPMCYPFYAVTVEYGKLAENTSCGKIALVPWIPVAVLFTGACLIIACLCFGKAERS